MLTETKMPQNCTFHKQGYSSLAFIFFTLIHYFQESMKVGEVIPNTGPIPVVLPLKLFLDFLRDHVFPRGLTDSQSYAPIFANDATHCVGILSAVNIGKNGDVWLASWGRGRAGENGMSNFIFSPPAPTFYFAPPPPTRNILFSIPILPTYILYWRPRSRRWYLKVSDL